MSRDKPVLRAIKLLTLMGAAESLKAYGVGRRLKSASG
jgi:hypothetical protein